MNVDCVRDDGSLNTSRVEIDGVHGQNKAIWMLGFGAQWTDEFIMGYVSHIERFEIITQDKKLVITDKKELTEFFSSGDKGLLRKTLRKKISENF